MKALSQIMALKRRLKSLGAKYRHSYKVTLDVNDYDEAYTSKHDGFSYPEMIQVTISAWSTCHYSIRVSDGMWIREGRRLDGKGQTHSEVYRDIIKMTKAHRDWIDGQRESALRSV